MVCECEAPYLVNCDKPWRAQKYIPIPGTHLDNDYNETGEENTNLSIT